MINKGFGLTETKQSIEIIHDIRNNSIEKKGQKHPFLNNLLKNNFL
jgi:hypothetical protein